MTQQAPITEPPVTDTIEEQAEPQCCHHWAIQPATGPVSTGVCQICGEIREFKNYVEASTWGDDKGASRTRNVVAQTVADRLEGEEEE